MKKIISAMMLGLLSLGCHASELGMGFLEPTSTVNGKRTLHSNAKIDNKSILDVQHTDKTGKTKCCHRIAGSSFKYLGESTKLYVNDDAKGLMYETETQPAAEDSDDVLNAVIINADSVAAAHPNSITATKREESYLFEQCNGAEGVNLYEKRAERILAKVYFFLGYDIEQTCQHNEKVKYS